MRFEYEFGDVADENNDLVAKVEMHEHGTLLAAAPELLEALEGLIDTLGPAYTQDTAGRPWITAALFAIARAKGGA